MRNSAAFLAGAGAGAGAGYLVGTSGGRQTVGRAAARLRRLLAWSRRRAGARRAPAVGAHPVPTATVELSSKVVDAARAAASEPTPIVSSAIAQPTDLEAGNRMPSQRSAHGEANGQANGEPGGPLT